MGGIELMPLECGPGIAENIVNRSAAFSGDMGVLTAPDQKHLARNLGYPVQRIVAPAQAEGT